MTSEDTLALTTLKDSCESCSKLELLYGKEKLHRRHIVVHADRSIISKNKVHEGKKKTLRRIEKVVSAFMNSGGGHILVHLCGQNAEDRCIEQFDEFINKRFHDFIDDGQLYVRAYKRHWLSEQSTFEKYSDVVRVIVGKVSSLATVDYNTRVCSDLEITRPTSCSIEEILLQTPTQAEHKPRLRKLDVNVQCLHENRHIENKAVKIDLTSKSVSEVTEYIWENLKLKENITSKSKIYDGGSYYLGIAEIVCEHTTYKTKIPKVEGFQVNNIDDLIASIKSKARNTLTVLCRVDGQGPLQFSEAPDDLIEIEKHLLEDSQTPTKYVLEIAIRYVEGIVFFDTKGPLTYTVGDNERITRMDRETWLHHFQKRINKSQFSETVVNNERN